MPRKAFFGLNTKMGMCDDTVARSHIILLRLVMRHVERGADALVHMHVDLISTPTQVNSIQVDLAGGFCVSCWKPQVGTSPRAALGCPLPHYGTRAQLEDQGGQLTMSQLAFSDQNQPRQLERKLDGTPN